MEQNIPSRIIKKRGRLLESGKSNAYRLVHGAGDGFKGFHLDRLGDYLLASKEGKPDLAEEDIARGWMSRLKSRGVYLKQLQRHVRHSNKECSSPKIWLGNAGQSETTIIENGVHYQIRFDEGYSVGIFLDQRENRQRWLQQKVNSRFALNIDALKSGDILNTFSYTCPFSVCIAKSGLRAVSLDLSKKYLDWGKKNFQLNELHPDTHDFIYGDVFDWMRRFRNRGRIFSGIILDPPTFSKAPKSKKMFQAERDYPDLLNLALDIIEPGGVILACNNTVGWMPGDFEKTIDHTLMRRGVVCDPVYFAQQPPEFPVSLQSPQYLKSAWIKVTDAGRG